MEKADSFLCPSFEGARDSRLLGIRQGDGKISILPNPLLVDDNFFNRLSKDDNPEQKYRFVNSCEESSCKQWTKKGCGVALRVIKFLDKIDPSNNIPKCSIRHDCRWYHQQGIEICKMCPYVITNVSAEEINDFFSKTEVAVDTTQG